ncbi:MAG: hypothetical protein LAT52_12050, partial [Balneolales bacterium]|nr:hypothetical protein [Balneolales bacterium]
RVTGERLKWPQFFPEATADTILTPASHHFRPDAGGVKAPLGPIWGWLPKPGFHNERRIDPITRTRNPVPAMSNDPSSWPEYWPDRLDNPDDPGWPGQWNGYFGKGVLQADLETYYVIDDFGDHEYTINAQGQLFSPHGVFYPNSRDSTMGGLGLTVAVRYLQWANVLAEDNMFMLYEITNSGDYNHGTKPDEGLYFYKVVDYGLTGISGQEDRGIGAFDPQFNLAFGWDADGIGRDFSGRLYPLGYVGFAFLESPANPFDGNDNDEDGITDERRDSGPGMLIEGRENIRAYVEANYNMAIFENTTIFQGYGPLEERPAYIAGRWWTGDENLNWVGFTDLNENGVWDEGEPLNDDLGRDGLGPFDPGYTGPDTGEADGIPTPGEPNFDALDVRESDQIGLRGFSLDDRRIYQSGDNLRNDAWLWQRIADSEFPLGTMPDAFEVFDIEPYLLFMSGPVTLPPGRTDFFSLGWLFGSDRNDFYRNRATVQNIYDANYRFAQPPIPPTLTAIPGDGRVVLAWDTLSVRSFDRFTQEFDFEGYRLYKGTDPLLSDARVITNVDGVPTFYRPIAQWDLINEYFGPVSVMGGTASYHLGDNTGLQFYYVDENVTNGVRYYYALVAYDRGVWSDTGVLEIDPQENTFNFSVDAFANIRGVSDNAAVVVPRPRAAGFSPGGANEDLSRVTGGMGTGSIEVEVVNNAEANFDAVYRLEFESETISAIEYVTSRYRLIRANDNEVIFDRDVGGSSPYVEGFFVRLSNDNIIEPFTDRSGWVDNYMTENELFSMNPLELEGSRTNWTVSIEPDRTPDGEYIAADYELRWFDENVYLPPRFQAINYLRDSLNVIAVNLQTGQQADLLIVDRNGNGTFDVEDELIIVERVGVFRFRHRINFSVPQGAQSLAPANDEVIRIANKKPFATGDFFQFTLSDASFDADQAKEQLDRIAVVPNPYLASSAYELRTSSVGRSERRIAFINLPAQCTIRIYNVRGELIQTINRDAAIDDGMEYWDLKTRDFQDVAYGVYIFHVDAPGIGSKTGKFALIK